MRVGFFGGSFDPPHRGHLTVALAAAEAFRLDRVLLAPTGRQPLKPNGPAAPFADRLAMIELLCKGHAPLEASGIDAPQPGDAPNYTIDTVGRLRLELDPADELFILVGVDAFLDLRRWHEPERLLAAAEWIVVSRPGLDRERLDDLQLTTQQQQRVHWLDGVADPASATGIREALQAGRNPGDLVLPRVLEYIHAHHLYGSAPA